jgi:hypothetical protein
VIVVASNGPGMRWGGGDRPDQKTVTVTDKEQKTGVDLVVAGAMSISGVVIGPDGKPAASAQVSAALEEEGRSARGMFGAEKAFTDFDGRFTIERLAAGPHTVWAEQAGFAEAQREHVPSGAKDVKLAFPRESTLGGVVTTSDGKPVPDYTIAMLPGGKPGETQQDRQERVRSAAWQSPTDIVHDPAGRFLFRSVNRGLHELRVTTANGSGGSQTVALGEGEERKDVRVVIDVGGRIVGRVVDLDSNQPLARIAVRAFAMGTARNEPGTQTDASGRFALEGIPALEQAMLFVTDPEERHITERRQLEVKSAGDLDVGTIRLQAGNQKARMEEGTWSGLTGINSTADDRGLVEMARPGTPAAAAGILKGDQILAIDGKDVQGMSFGQIEWRLRGKPGTSITVTVRTPGNDPRTVTFARFDAENPPPPPAAPKANAPSGK